MDPKIRTLIGYVFPDYRYMRNEWSNIRDTFLFEQYKWLVQDLKPNTTAYDFGAAMGDSTIYLAMNPNISKVIAYEMNAQHYKRAVANISKNQYRAKIKIFNKKAEFSGAVKNSIIKCDIDGGEHQLFTSGTDLSNIYKMQMEYHYGLKELPRILKGNGFKIKTEKTANVIFGGEVGWIYAKRSRS